MKKFLFFISIPVAILITSCSLFDTNNGGENTTTDISAEITKLKDQLKNLTAPEGIETGAPREMIDEEISSQADTENPDQKTLNELGQPVTYKTTLKKFKASAAFDTQVLLNPGTDVIYPGSVLLGHTIDDGSYQEVTSGKKRNITISYDLTGVKKDDGTTGKVSGEIIPSLSKYRDLHNEILGQLIPGQTSIYSYEYTEINDESEMNLKFNAGVSYASPTVSGSVKAGFEYSKTNKKNKYMIKFMQTFYTVDIDQGNGTFLYEDFDIDDFKGYRPVYISSVAYGRLAYLTIETSKSWQEIKANLDVIVNIKPVDIGTDVSFSAALTSLKENTKFNITVIGGTTVATSVEGFEEFLREGGFSSENSGKIVSYKLRFVDDNSVANTIFNGEYTMRTVEAVQGKGIKVSFQAYQLKSVGDDGWNDNTMEFYGNVSVVKDGETKYLWSRVNSVKTHNMNGQSTSTFTDAFTENTFNMNSNSFELKITGFGEDDGSSGDDSFADASLIKYVSDVGTSKTFFTLRSKDNSCADYIEFKIAAFKEYLY